jgi:hypothetical protein
MTMIRLVAGLAIALAGCYEQTPQPQYPQAEEVAGPPGGGMDQPSEAQYEADSQPAESAAYSPSYADQTADSEQVAEPEPSADPQDPGYDMGPVNDAEIDSTLQPYGEWVEDPDYGRVWRPYATVVGADFTPYQSCGEWIWTDWGWSYACDWDWGWLPFHYGRWDWFDDGYWGWVPGYEWGPGWVDWRHGGGYVGWRPTAPEVRDHRGGNFHDHRHGMHDGQWSFVNDNDFGKGHIRPHLYKDLAQGLAVTTPVVKPNIRALTQPVRVASTMRARMTNPIWRQQHAPAGGWRQPVTAHTPVRQGPVWRQPQQGWRQPPAQSFQQHTWQQPQRTWQQPQRTWQQPPQRTWQRPQTWQVPQSQHPIYTRPAYTAPTYTRPTYTAPTNTRPTYTPPTYTRPTWTAPRPTYTAPRPSYSPPTYSAPSHSWSAPSHSYSAPSHSYSAPSHSYGGGGGGHFSGGGGGRRR